MRKIDPIVIHCSTARESTDHNLEQLGSDYKARGFLRAGYNLYIHKPGEMVSLRPLEQILAHAKGHNKRSTGICYEGGPDITGQPRGTRIQAQKTSLLCLIQHLLVCFPGPWVCGYRNLLEDLDGDGTISPDEWIKQCPPSNTILEYKELVYELRKK